MARFQSRYLLMVMVMVMVIMVVVIIVTIVIIIIVMLIMINMINMIIHLQSCVESYQLKLTPSKVNLVVT